MPVRNGDHGYGGVSKALHWLTVSALLGQFLVGYSMDLDDGGHGRGRGRGEGSGHGRGRGGEDGYADLFGDGFGLPELHVVLGVTVLVLALLRVGWRRVGGLPPWADALSPAERTLEAWLEKVLLASLFLMPISGLALVLSGEDDWLPLHVAAHVVFFVAVGLHVGLVLWHTVVRRDRHLARML
jgi:cytochrome b561